MYSTIPFCMTCGGKGWIQYPIPPVEEKPPALENIEPPTLIVSKEKFEEFVAKIEEMESSVRELKGLKKLLEKKPLWEEPTKVEPEEDRGGVQRFSGNPKRVETGPMQFGTDWPGVFIRGDNALYLAHILELILERHRSDFHPIMEVATLEGFIKLLRSCYAKPQPKQDQTS